MAKRYSKKIEKTVKKGIKKHLGSFIAVTLTLVVFLVAGFVACTVMTKNDGLYLVNEEKNTSIAVGGIYTEEGAYLTGFGKDLSEYIVIEIKDYEGETVTYVNTDTDSVYYVLYSVKSVDDIENLSFIEKFALSKFEDYRIIRTITVGEGV